jgi:hypothetical protein
MDTAKINAYVTLLATAETIGIELYDLIVNHAQQTLTPEEYDALASRWDADAARARMNAGI